MTDTIEDQFIENDCNNVHNRETDTCNKLLLKQEAAERTYLEKNDDTDNALYPTLNDPQFIVKIAKKKEFHDHTYDGDKHDVRTYADETKKGAFELAPHQLFVKNYLSYQTPYNSLLLYHQLGTGKTCSAIGICEEMREYMREVGVTKRIMIIASPNVQDNFRLQLFDDRKLKDVNGLWAMEGCIGNSFIKEINPTNMTGISREKIVSQIQNLINRYYVFMGYEKFSKYINRVSQEGSGIELTKAQIVNNLRREFSSRLIVIDEVHNMRISEENPEIQKVAKRLIKLVTYVDNVRLLLLSATPMYNTPREIIWILNLMNANDGRGQINIRDVFDKNGKLKKDGRALLIQKATGYISYVRGENPYTFPYRVYPDIFDPSHTFSKQEYPQYQLNGRYIKVEKRMKVLKDRLFVTKIGKYQSIVYDIMTDKINATNKDAVSFNYTVLQSPLEALVMTYPMDGVEDLKGVVGNVNKVMDTSSGDNNGENTDVVEHSGDVNENDTLRAEVNGEDTTSLRIVLKPEISPEKDRDTYSSVDGDFVLKPKYTRKASPRDESVQSSDTTHVDVEITEKPSSEYSIMSAGAVEREDMLDSEKDEESDDREEDNDSDSGADVRSDTDVMIDTSALTGKKGLARIMRFTDSITPKIKGNFAYRTEKHGRIFSPEHIGKYSSKIKTICDHIMQSTGIVLVYSQWLDSGLIPMALALEELGFKGTAGKSLFATPPTEEIDSTTMKKRDQPGGDDTSFYPAKYALITGDERLSPDNDADIKALTDEKNKDGKYVKVVLISKAASEGIDLKCVRQIHILEPWYTMSRIEQIIGRGVRNFSHALLPFEERNVEIFLHTTLLNDRELESADTYIYRHAEYKALQIGQVSRILKETSVDCLLNTEQNNFSQLNMKTEIEQRLSDGKIMNKFKVGDIPYSAMCDYMEDCNVKCYPNVDIKDNMINTDTYDDFYIRVNSEAIVQKIKMLMREEFFYRKDVLIAKINHPKPFPKVEIYAALTHIIEDVTEVVTDKYGRTGTLVNIGKYYLFQPNDLTAENASIFDRKTPVDFKPIQFSVRESTREGREDRPEALEPIRAVSKRSGPEESGSQEERTAIETVGGKSIVEDIDANLKIAIEYASKEKIPRGDTHYYKHWGLAMKKLNGVLDVSIDRLTLFLVHHAIDVLPYEKKLQLLNYVSNLHVLTETDMAFKIKAYFDKFIVRTKRLQGIVMYQDKERHILIFDKQSVLWRESEEEDRRDLSSVLTQRYTVDTRKFNTIVGFIQDVEREEVLVFKTIDTTSKRSHGSRCENTTKSKNIDLLNKVTDTTSFTKDTVSPLIDIGICCMQEMVFRLFEASKPEKIWFIDPDTAKMYNF